MKHYLDVAAELAPEIAKMRSAAEIERHLAERLRVVFRENEDEAEMRGARWMREKAARVAETVYRSEPDHVDAGCDAERAKKLRTERIAAAIRSFVVPRGLS